MSELRLIVDCLNAKPFEKNLSLVAFDEKSNFELLEIVNDVFIELDEKHKVKSFRDEADEDRTYRFVQFLKLLNYPACSDLNEEYENALSNGERYVLYPILFWTLKSLANHKKRAYLGRYLAPLQVPSEFLGDPGLNDLNDHYREMQLEFKRIHKIADQNRKNNMQPTSLRKEIVQLDEERTQLEEKIAYLKRKSKSQDGFSQLLQATSALRKEQEEQAKIIDRKHDQEMGIAIAEKRYRETYQHVEEMKAATEGTVSAEQLFQQLHKRVEYNRHILSNAAPKDLDEKKSVLQELELKLRAPRKTEADINQIEDEIVSLKQQIDHFNEEIATAQRSAGDDKMAIFRQHASAQVKKLAEKEEELQVSISEMQKNKRRVDELETSMSQIAGPKFMKREEFKQYANTLRNKTTHFKKLKSELAIMNAETVALHRTEQILKGQCPDLESLMAKLEEKNGIDGYMNTQERIEHVSEQSAKINITKGQTLEEIGKIVTDINHILKDRKNQLAPQIKELRQVRSDFQILERDYVQKKGVYENSAVGMETERIQLEQECNAFQDDCIQEECKYHTLQCQISIEDAKYEKVQREMEYENGNGRLLRDFETFQNLYNHKITQQESLSKELRKQQKTLRETGSGTTNQRSQFDALLTLLQAKAKSVIPNAENPAESKDFYNALNSNQYLDAKQYGGGANIMTIDDD